MTNQQTTAIRSLLRAAPTSALRRVVRQPERLWRTERFDPETGKGCLITHLCHGGYMGNDYADFIIKRGAAHAFDAACAADGLRATVREAKRLAREEVARRG